LARSALDSLGADAYDGEIENLSLLKSMADKYNTFEDKLLALLLAMDLDALKALGLTEDEINALLAELKDN